MSTEDVLFTLELIKSDVSAYPRDIKDFWEEVEINKLDELTLQFVLPEPFAPFLDFMTFKLLPKHLLGDVPPDQIPDADFNLSPVGTGPYKFDRLIVENGRVAGVHLKPYDGYYLDKPFIEQVVFRFYPSSSEALSAYQQGDVLAVSLLTADVLRP